MRVIGLQSLTSTIKPKIIADIEPQDGAHLSDNEITIRNNLASLYRIVDQLGVSQSIFNHMTARVSQKDEEILINPFGLLYHEVTASNLVKVNLAGDILGHSSSGYGVNRAGYLLHSAIHGAHPEYGCVIHLHIPDVVAVASLKCGLLPLSQESMIIGDVAYHEYEGIINNKEEKERMISDLSNKKVMLLKNHGFVCCGESIAEALFLTFHLIIACETQIKIMAAAGGNIESIVIPSIAAQEATLRVIRTGGGGVNMTSNVDNIPELNDIKWAKGEMEWEAWVRILDDNGLKSGYKYKKISK
uniref:Aldolase_II domain-containing protein n=1 Tax=Rhabditophanes sp. KR3021 TaxID=114890 RepID=A0AC35U629_9BILA